MSNLVSRREVLARLGTTGAGSLLGVKVAQPGQQQGAAGARAITVAGRRVEFSATVVSPQTLRLGVLPVLDDGSVEAIADDLVLVKQDWPEPVERIRSIRDPQMFFWGKLRVSVSSAPLALKVGDYQGNVIQQIEISKENGAVRFSRGERPVFGLGEGGPQFDRRGVAYPMKSGEGVHDVPVDGARMPVPWLVSAQGWALFFHQPLGSFDLIGKDGRFTPWTLQAALPLDVFLIVAEHPPDLLTEYARLTGFPHLPPIWALGYQQSHRTLASREEVLSEAKTFREKKLPCDALIYLGTGFCPSGWNTGHGSFVFNNRAFPDPAAMIRDLHQKDFKIVLHVVNPPEGLHGQVSDTGAAARPADDAARYWATHLDVFRLGVDGWWPDEGDDLSPTACLVRNRMYWEGPAIERPSVRPYALNRNGYAGLQRYGWLWSGDIDSTWEALRAQVSVGLNTSLSGVPFWGTDTGGFVTTKELTGELYVRWFQFSAFCPLFRSHGRTWKLRLPWGWNTGDYGPTELEGYHGNAALPDPRELHNPHVEPICRKYLELRYRLLPYLYSAVREAHDTGIPVIRALWLHYPDDPRAVECGDQYLWGRDMLVAPVTEKGATSRRLYLPRGLWHDFWTEEKVEGGREIERPVDLATIPLYVRAGAVLPIGPVRQYATQMTDDPLTNKVYPGADGELVLYEDDGISFNYRRGEFMRMRALWSDRDRQLSFGLVDGSKMLEPTMRKIDVCIAASKSTRRVVFGGTTEVIRF